MKNYLEIAGNVHLSFYVEAADILEIPYEITVHKLVAKFYTPTKHWFIINTVVPVNNVPSSTIAKRKHLTNLILEKASVPVPLQAKLQNEDEAIDFFNQHKNIVIKPAQNIGGGGVSVLPKTQDDVIKAYRDAYEKSKTKDIRVLGEKFIQGDNYRILVLDKKVIGVIFRHPAEVKGNGINSIAELIEIENEERRKNLLKPIKIDNEVTRHLFSINMTFDSIPEPNQVVHLRSNANLSTGGTAEECSDLIHPYYADMAIKAVSAIGLKLGGVDLITTDITQPVEGSAINEVNYNPGLRPHYMVGKGRVIKVAVPIMEYIRDNYPN